MPFRIVTYDTNSKAYNFLLRTLGAKGIKPYDSEYVYKETDRILNWGLYGTRPFPVVMNQWNAVAICTSKVKTFRAFRDAGVAHPEWTQHFDVAHYWLSKKEIVYARAEDSGHMGAGITVVYPEHPSDLPHVPLYTVGFPIAREFRVYVAYDKIIDIREKIKPPHIAVDLMVRASDDWLYSVREPEQCPEDLLQQSLAACKAVGLDFCGVDIALDVDNNACVFEVNSAPWLGTITVNRLVKILKEKFE
jgi:hypothetical protein